MAYEPGGIRRDRQEKVVSLGRHELVAEIERKLAEARRMFSLHGYEACEKLALEVMEVDPQNSKAKALLDLSAIKLSKKRLYRKIVETPHPLAPKPESTTHAESVYSPIPPSVEHKGTPSTGYLSQEPLNRGDTEQIIARPEESSSTPAHASSPGSLHVGDTLRERTVSALVELFRHKTLSLADWRDPRRSDRKLELVKTPSKETLPVVPSSITAGLSLEPQKQKPSIESPDTRPEFGHISEAGGERSPTAPNYQELVEKKLEERSEDLRKSEIKTISIAQIKKYLYQEEYELCSQELSKIRKLFPHSTEIQAFVENTSKRLAELQHNKTLELQAHELMLTATMLYQEGKLPEALIAANEVMRLLPNHQQAREFVEFVNKRVEKEWKKSQDGGRGRYCWSCGVAVDNVSQFCFHCGQRLS